ncbi:MAG: hypothetical protein ACUVQ1_09270, partial [Candidatus Kapaibacteriales bacterium]
KFNYLNKVTKCLLDDFIFSLKNLLSKDKYFLNKFQILKLFIIPTKSNLIEFFYFSFKVRGPPIFT